MGRRRGARNSRKVEEKVQPAPAKAKPAAPKKVAKPRKSDAKKPKVKEE